MVTINLPSQLQGLAGGRRVLQLHATTLGEALHALDVEAPMVRSQLFEPSGAIRQFVGLFVDSRQLSELGDGGLALSEGSSIVVVMAVAGG